MRLAVLFRLGFTDVPPFFLDDMLRPNGRARSTVGAGIAPATIPTRSRWGET
jgi:hypothetical protein